MNQRPGDRRSLLLTAAQLMNKMIGPFPQPDELDQFSRALVAFLWRNTLKQERQGNVLAHVHRRQQVEELKDEPDLVPPEIRQRRIIRCLQRQTIDNDLAGRRTIQSREQMNQRALTAPARAANRDKLVSRDLE